MENGASRMTLHHGIGEKNTGSMLSVPGVRLWKSFLVPFPNESWTRAQSIDKIRGLFCFILIHTMRSICRNSECPKKSIEGDLRSLRFRTVRSPSPRYFKGAGPAVYPTAWSGRFTLPGDQNVNVWQQVFKYIKIWCFEPGAPLRKVLQGIFIDSSQPFSHTGLPHQKATKDGPANNCRKVQWRLVNHEKNTVCVFVEFSQPFFGG